MNNPIRLILTQRQTALPRLVWGLIAFALAALALALSPKAAFAQAATVCLPGGNSCTANDLTVHSMIILPSSPDLTCENASDTITVDLQAQAQPQGGSTRYDIGVYVSKNGLPVQGNGNNCSAHILGPDLTTVPGNVNNLSGIGPYWNDEGDYCGDSDKGALVYHNLDRLTLPCIDPDNDGIMEVHTCFGWGNQKNEIQCTDPVAPEVQHAAGTGAKCFCEPAKTSPAIRFPPRVTIVKTGATQAFPPNQITYTVVVQNTGPRPAQNVVISDVLDASLSFVSGGWTGVNDDGTSVPNGTCTSAGQNVTCSLGTLPYTDGVPVTTRTIQIVVNIISEPPDPLLNTACVDGEDNLAPPITFHECKTVTTETPVTLAFFQASQQGGKLRFDWSTATEAGNAGFNLYVKSGSSFQRINGELIASQDIDSLEPQNYTYEATGFGGDAFYIETVDIFNRSRMFGPYLPGQAFGRQPAMKATNWSAIRAEHDAKTTQRLAAELALSTTQIRPISSQASRQQLNAPAAPVLPFIPKTTLYLPLNLVNADRYTITYPIINLEVDQDGLYRVTYEALLGAGFDLNGARASDLALTNNGSPTPIRVVSKYRFGPGASIEFYGKAIESMYTRTNIYTLSVERSKALRVVEDGTAPSPGAVPVEFYQETAEVASNREYSFLSSSGDPWYMTQFLAQKTPKTWDFTVKADGYVANAAPASLSVTMWGASDMLAGNDHHVQLALNGANLADLTFDRLDLVQPSIDLPEGTLQAGDNQLSITLPGDLGNEWDIVNLEGYSLTYPRTFDARQGALTFTANGQLFQVTGLPSADVVVYRLEGDQLSRLTTVNVTGSEGDYQASFAGKTNPATYVISAAEALLSPTGIRLAHPPVDITSGIVDYLVISHPDFIDGLATLVQARQSGGYQVRLVDIEDVFQQYSYGILDPQAIRDYIAYAHNTMGTRFVLLVGGDTYDYLDYQGYGGFSFIPSLYTATDSLVQFAPVDPLYADVNQDNLPDLAIGRFPVRTSAELAAIIDKTLAYEAKDYTASAVFAADRRDGPVSFTENSEALAAELSDWNIQRAYIDEVGVDAARQTLLNSLNHGVALANYVGHSGPWDWTFLGLFDGSDAASLSNHGRPIVVSQWGCWNTYFVDPAYDTLAHQFMLNGDQGAAAVLGTTTITYDASEAALGRVMTPLLTSPGMTIGEAITKAKQLLAITQPGLRDVILGWTILGDPALVVQP